MRLFFSLLFIFLAYPSSAEIKALSLKAAIHSGVIEKARLQLGLNMPFENKLLEEFADTAAKPNLLRENISHLAENQFSTSERFKNIAYAGLRNEIVAKINLPCGYSDQEIAEVFLNVIENSPEHYQILTAKHWDEFGISLLEAEHVTDKACEEEISLAIAFGKKN